MKKIVTLLLICLVLVGCSSTKKQISKSINSTFSSSFYKNQFTGLLIVNAQNQDTLLNFNGEKYFTPASNTKIFTLFSALQLLSDSIPTLKYLERNDTLYMEGTGDPTLLHKAFENNKTLDFLKPYEHIAVHLNNFEDQKYGPGWSWDDYGFYYQAEKSPLPLYGNVVTLHNTNKTSTTPSHFSDAVIPIEFSQNREIDDNRFYFSTSRKDTLEIPFRTNSVLTKTLLEKELQKKITLIAQMPLIKKKVLKSVPVDTVYKRMMHLSDNFIAEQLLILGSSTLSDSLNSNTAREYILANQLAHLRQPPRWVDGSGLSRYNLFTPESIVAVLNQLYTKIDKERLFGFFPAGGASGTLKDWYGGDPNPYLYAKSGSLGNTYCLSGYLLTKSGKTLIFSFMNNHFKQPSSEVKKQMERLFEAIRDSY